MPDQNDVLRAIMSVLQNPAVRSAIASSPFSVPSIQQSGPIAGMAMGARVLTPNVPETPLSNWVNEFESAASQAPAVANNVKESLANLFQRGGQAPSGRNVWVDQQRLNQVSPKFVDTSSSDEEWRRFIRHGMPANRKYIQGGQHPSEDIISRPPDSFHGLTNRVQSGQELSGYHGPGRFEVGKDYTDSSGAHWTYEGHDGRFFTFKGTGPDKGRLLHYQDLDHAVKELRLRTNPNFRTQPTHGTQQDAAVDSILRGASISPANSIEQKIASNPEIWGKYVAGQVPGPGASVMGANNTLGVPSYGTANPYVKQALDIILHMMSQGK